MTTETIAPVAAQVRLGCALRDFYIAGQGDEMADAYGRLASINAMMPKIDNQDALEFGFNRLFVGPKAPEAPPYASIYLDEDGLVMGPSTDEVRDLYQSLGVESPWKGAFPEDHLALEIDACLMMRQAIDTCEVDSLVEIYADFLETHLLKWVPLFVKRITALDSAPAPIAAVACLTVDWLKQERSATIKGAGV